MRARRTKDGPFAWMSKRVIRVIEEALDGSEIKYSTALSVYAALCVISSDEEGHDSFSTTIGLISKKSGVGNTRVFQVLSIFEDLRIIHILRKRSPKKYMKEPSIYTLLPETEVLWRFCDEEPDLRAKRSKTA